jgi:hypothetical protein
MYKTNIFTHIFNGLQFTAYVPEDVNFARKRHQKNSVSRRILVVDNSCKIMQAMFVHCKDVSHFFEVECLEKLPFLDLMLGPQA